MMGRGAYVGSSPRPLLTTPHKRCADDGPDDDVTVLQMRGLPWKATRWDIAQVGTCMELCLQCAPHAVLRSGGSA